MNIYKISRLDEAAYDEYIGAIVVADTIESARFIEKLG